MRAEARATAKAEPSRAKTLRRLRICGVKADPRFSNLLDAATHEAVSGRHVALVSGNTRQVVVP